MKNKESEKRFIITKYVMARNASEALLREKSAKPHDVYIDQKWIDENKSFIGFRRS